MEDGLFEYVKKKHAGRTRDARADIQTGGKWRGKIMTINDQLVRAYLGSKDMEKYRDEWFFGALEAGKNVFEYSAKGAETAENVETLWRMIQNVTQDFRPANAAIWDALFPDWPSIPVHIDLIVGFPKPYDAVTMKDESGQTHIVLDLIRWCDYGFPKNPESMARNLLAHEMTHAFIGACYPEADAASDGADYRAKLDALTFHEGFAHLIAYNDTAIERADWNSDFWKRVERVSREKMREAVAETDPERQRAHLRNGFCGRYEEKYACMCGVLYLVKQWQKSGMDGLKVSFADYHGFAEKTIES